MSMILDALRKMEQEHRVRRAQGTDIRPEVLARRTAAVSPGKKAGAAVAGALLLVAGVAGGYLLKKESPAPGPAAVSPTAQLPVPAAPAAPHQALAAAPAPAPPQTTARVRTKRFETQDAPAEVKLHPHPAGVSPAPEAAPGDITVSGIAWQDERKLRRAVVNGALVHEGSEVAGARVVEIRENRVRFSREGRFFEVIFSAGSPAK